MKNLYRSIQSHLLMMLSALAILSCMLVTPAVAAGKYAGDHSHLGRFSLADQIPLTGKLSADGRYQVYRLEGELDDLNWFGWATAIDGSREPLVYKHNDLFKGMPFLEEADARSPNYACGYVCKDRLGQIVGINPSYKKVMLESLPKARSKRTASYQ